MNPLTGPVFGTGMFARGEAGNVRRHGGATPAFYSRLVSRLVRLCSPVPSMGELSEPYTVATGDRSVSASSGVDRRERCTGGLTPKVHWGKEIKCDKPEEVLSAIFGIPLDNSYTPTSLGGEGKIFRSAEQDGNSYAVKVLKNKKPLFANSPEKKGLMSPKGNCAVFCSRNMTILPKLMY